jgi:hypothetical protein
MKAFVFRGPGRNRSTSGRWLTESPRMNARTWGVGREMLADQLSGATRGGPLGRRHAVKL